VEEAVSAPTLVINVLALLAGRMPLEPRVAMWTVVKGLAAGTVFVLMLLLLERAILVLVTRGILPSKAAVDRTIVVIAAETLTKIAMMEILLKVMAAPEIA